jgi:hypothetical protein
MPSPLAFSFFFFQIDSHTFPGADFELRSSCFHLLSWLGLQACITMPSRNVSTGPWSHQINKDAGSDPCQAFVGDVAPGFP